MKVITAVAAAEKEAIQITWVRETLKRMMGQGLEDLKDLKSFRLFCARARGRCQRGRQAAEAGILSDCSRQRSGEGLEGASIRLRREFF